eukprot:TRINITY_DN15155_c0_g1_i1.p1 TRINITY_DN15155_c0_g1~~TRINITY_DN15155_c0_g1_i1.p1  ORF type:complete len:420 (-),score=71.71 TRINITY_DN15155_c0_g1_i1:52-1311(-)
MMRPMEHAEPDHMEGSLLEEKPKVPLRSFRRRLLEGVKYLSQISIGGTPVLAWISLCIGLLSSSINGPSFKKLSQLGVPILVSPTWRSQGVLMILLIPTAWELYNLYKTGKILKMKNKRTLILSIAMAFQWSSSMIFWLIGTLYTSLAKAALLVCAYPVILVIYYKIRRTPISKWEVIGTCIGFCGVALTFVDALGASSSSSDEWIGDLSCVCAAIVNAAGVIWGSSLRQTMDLTTYTFTTTLSMGTIVAIASLTYKHTTFDADGPNSLFGWTQPEYFYLTAIQSTVVGTVCIMAYNYALKHTPPLAFAVFKLMEPIATGIMSYILKLDSVPTIWTVIGGIGAVLGVFLVQYGLQKRLSLEKMRFVMNTASAPKSVEIDGGDSESDRVDGVDESRELEMVQLDEQPDDKKRSEEIGNPS